jgi:hypothetical protein
MRKGIGAPLFYTLRAGDGQIGRARPALDAARIEQRARKVQVAAGGCGYDF